MAKPATTCSRCGRTLEVEGAPGERVVCGECEPTLAFPSGARPPSAADPLLGQCLGPFEIVGLLGRGGMGGVYKARQASLDRFVAIKILSPALAADTDFVARFEREARAEAAIHHPNIIRVYSVGQERGYQYIAMELVEGESLAEMLAREGRLAPERALGLLKQVAGALAEAHACGIVHRDIKPSNILVTREGVAKVADFGLAKRQASDVTVTHTGTTLGTPLYMAPEIGRGHRLDARSDLYSLGATFYHLLAGRPPFQADTAPELIVKHASELPPPLGAVAPHVDPRLSRLIDQLLCKEPEERVPSAKALLGRLEALGPLQTPDEAAQAEARAMLLDSPTLAMTSGRRLERQAVAERLRRELKPARNAKALIAAAAGALVLLTALLLLLAGGGRKPPAQTAKAPSPAPALATVSPEKEPIADVRAKAEEPAPREEAPPPPKLPDEPGDWVSLFDGQTLNGWRVADQGVFAGPRNVRVEDGAIVLGQTATWTGIICTRAFPTTNYELEIEATPLTLDSDFCSLSFPVGGSGCCLSVNGFGGGIVALGWIDGRNGDVNGMAKAVRFEPGRPYRVRLCVTDERIEGWIDQDKLISVPRQGHSFTPLANLGRMGVYTAGSRAALRSIRLRRLRPEAEVARPVVPEFAGKPGEWVSLFDGETLDGWRVADGRWFAGHGNVVARDGLILLEAGADHTGIAMTRNVPTVDYEICADAMRVAGDADFCNIVFPVGASHCGLLVGGWGGRVVALNMVDGHSVEGNPTTLRMDFDRGRWYPVRLRVTEARIEAWIDKQKVIDIERAGHQFALLEAHVFLKPLGLEAVKTRAALRNIRLRRLAPAAAAAPAEPFAGKPGEWLSLFDGKKLDGWRVVPFFPGPAGGRGGTAEVRDGHIVLEAGMPRTAIAWTGGFPTADYEVRVEATRILGGSDFCSIVFPLGAAHCIWVVGAYGGATSGVEVLDNTEAHFNETTRRLAFEQGRRYQVRLRVTKVRIEGWIDDEKVFDTLTAGHTFALRDFAQPVAPFGILTWNTTAGLRNISARAITPGPDDGPPPDEPPAGAKPVESATLAVAAHANWFDTGLYVTGGKAYELSASGLWGTGPTWPTCGPEGMPFHIDGRFQLAGIERKFSLIGRVGALGRPFQVGEKLALTPETTGRLYLRMNDPVASDNWGSLRVAVAGPLLAEEDAPLLARFTREARKLEVDAKSDWADSGVTVQPGDKLLIAAAGTWQAGPLLPPTNADGYQEALAFLRRGALVGKIGEQGRPFHVGQLLLLDAPKAGKLFLAMNDDARDDNQGRLTVTISSPPRPEPPKPRPKE